MTTEPRSGGKQKTRGSNLPATASRLNRNILRYTVVLLTPAAFSRPYVLCAARLRSSFRYAMELKRNGWAHQLSSIAKHYKDGLLFNNICLIHIDKHNFIVYSIAIPKNYQKILP